MQDTAFGIAMDDQIAEGVAQTAVQFLRLAGFPELVVELLHPAGEAFMARLQQRGHFPSPLRLPERRRSG